MVTGQTLEPRGPTDKWREYCLATPLYFIENFGFTQKKKKPQESKLVFQLGLQRHLHITTMSSFIKWTDRSLFQKQVE